MLQSIGLGACANLLPRIAEFHGVALPSWTQARPLLISNSVDCLMHRCCSGLGFVGVVHTRRWAVQRPPDDGTIGAVMVPRRSLRCVAHQLDCTRCGGGCGAIPDHRHGLRVSNSSPGVLGRKLAGDGAVRSRLGAIQAAALTVFRYCCARGAPEPGAGLRLRARGGRHGISGDGVSAGSEPGSSDS
jgi:hypothetical protein